jgi:hypothetical protein
MEQKSSILALYAAVVYIASLSLYTFSPFKSIGNAALSKCEPGDYFCVILAAIVLAFQGAALIIYILLNIIHLVILLNFYNAKKITVLNLILLGASTAFWIWLEGGIVGEIGIGSPKAYVFLALLVIHVGLSVAVFVAKLHQKESVESKLPVYVEKNGNLKA